jgi:hypothetical protein
LYQTQRLEWAAQLELLGVVLRRIDSCRDNQVGRCAEEGEEDEGECAEYRVLADASEDLLGIRCDPAPSLVMQERYKANTYQMHTAVRVTDDNKTETASADMEV